MSITRHPGTIGFGPTNPYRNLSIGALRTRLAAETDSTERTRLQARLDEREAHRRAQRRKKRARLEAEASR